MNLTYNWKFMKEDNSNFSLDSYDDFSWRTVRVPHDYAIEGPFAPENDAQFIEIKADGIKEPISQVGRTGGLPIADKAWYRKKLTFDKVPCKAFIEFDGIMSNSTIYINGHDCGGRPYGYSSFCIDITDKIRVGENTLAIRVAPEPCSSRWYTGAGIYRNVRLIEKNEVYLPYCPLCLKQLIQGEDAIITAELDICNPLAKNVTAEIVISNQKGEIVSEAGGQCLGDKITLKLPIKKYIAWDIDNPYQYNVEVFLKNDGTIEDTVSLKYGIRSVVFDAKKGLFFNGRYLKLNGVCMHHDLGALGAAVNVSAIRRQLRILKEFGTNAIRTSHNPPAPELLDLCDEMGFLVMDEVFDEWTMYKVTNGYHKHFSEWAEIDLIGMIKRDRNHASVIMWSIGNEIPEQTVRKGRKISQYLADIVRKTDNTRLITCGYNCPQGAFANGLTKTIDICGMNYQPKLYKMKHILHPKLIMLGSETSSCVSSRGEYFLPAKYQYPVKEHPSKLMSSYDMCGPGWAYSPDIEFFYQDKYKFVIGEFVWTGFDYIGEPTPYNCNWPARSSYFGIVDTAGLPKDRFYSYQSKWSDKKCIHLFPHWNWSEGDVIDIHCYCSEDSVELFLNGKSLGVRSKNKNKKMKNHRLIWEKVPFEKGILQAVAVNNLSLKDVVKTAGSPYKINLTPDRIILDADGNDMVFIRCDIVDIDGNICPKASDELHFEVSGVGEYVAADNGSQISIRTFSQPYCECFNGSLVVIVRTIVHHAGEIILKVTANNLPEQEIKIESKNTKFAIDCSNSL